MLGVGIAQWIILAVILIPAFCPITRYYYIGSQTHPRRNLYISLRLYRLQSAPCTSFLFALLLTVIYDTTLFPQCPCFLYTLLMILSNVLFSVRAFARRLSDRNHQATCADPLSKYSSSTNNANCISNWIVCGI